MQVALNKRIAVLSSTGGAVVKTVLANSSIKFDLIITDRECGAKAIAADFDIKYIEINEPKSGLFSDKLQKVLTENNIDFVMVFFTRLLKGRLLIKYKHRLINFHPSLLPACPGIRGFEDSIKSGSLLIGSTVHFIDQGVDTGNQLIQVKCCTKQRTTQELRHIIFSQQCASLLDIYYLINSEQLKITSSGFEVLNQTIDDNGISCPVFSEESYLLYLKLLSGNA